MSSAIQPAHDLSLFERDGFAIVREAIDLDTVSALIEAVDCIEENDDLRQRERDTYAIRNLLKNAPAVKALAESASIRAIAKRFLGAEAFAVRGLLFDKTPAANWKVTWHQDLTIEVRQRMEVPGYGPWSVKAGVHSVQPPVAILERMLTMRFHLDDCTKENGPLEVLPGSHKAGKLSAAEIQDWRARVPSVDCLAERGGLVLMRPLLLHGSASAKQPGHRRVIHLEFASGPLDGALQWNN